MPSYTLDNLPTTLTWVQELGALAAREQCVALGLQPAATLEENRVIIKNFVKSNRGPTTRILRSSTLNHPSTSVANADSLANRELFSQVTLFEQNPYTNSGTASPEHQANQADLISLGQNINNPLPQQPHTPVTQPTQNLCQSTPQIQTALSEELLLQIRSLNMDAISQTIQAVTSQLACRPEPSNRNSDYTDSNIPSFVREMLKDLPRADGTDLATTLRFLVILTRMLDLNLAPERSILLNATSYTTNRFRDFWIETIPHISSWQNLLTQFRQAFLTPDTLRRAQDQFLYRAQTNSEQLADFVKDIQTYHRILSPQTDHHTMFQTIFCRINPETRNALTGVTPLNTVQDLINASPFTASVKEQNFSGTGQTPTANNRAPNSQHRQNFHNPHRPNYRDNRHNNNFPQQTKYTNFPQQPNYANFPQQPPVRQHQFNVPAPNFPPYPFNSQQQFPQYQQHFQPQYQPFNQVLPQQQVGHYQQQHVEQAPRQPRPQYNQGWRNQNQRKYTPANQPNTHNTSQASGVPPAPNPNPMPGYTPGYTDNSSTQTNGNLNSNAGKS